jgi:nucleotide-binding universal stress UspA family protein
MFEKILVATDGSTTAAKAVTRAAQIAATTGDPLHVISAYAPGSVAKLEATRASLPDEFRWGVGADGQGNAALDAARSIAEQAGVKVETHLVRGEPARAIVDTADEIGARLIVVGSKGIERRIRGSVPNSVTQDANCDVLIVHTS